MHYLHYLSIWSFAKFNDGWRIYVHRPVTRSLNFDKADGGMYPELNVGNYWNRLASEVDCVINWVDFDRIGFYNGAGEVHKSDYLRLWLLSSMGGVWADTDILWYKPFPELPEVDAMFSAHGDYGHAIGLLGASPENEIYKRLLAEAKNAWHPHLCQSIGSVLYNRVVGPLEQRRFNQQIYNIPDEWIYWVMQTYGNPAVVWCNDIEPPEGSYGLHWYAGDAMAILAKPVNETYDKPNLMGNVIKRVLA